MVAARALIVAGAGLGLLYMLGIAAYFMTSRAVTETLPPDEGTIRYVVSLPSGESRVLDQPADQASTVLDVAQQQFGEVSAVRRLEPGEMLPMTSSHHSVPAWIFGLLVFPVGFLVAGLRANARNAHTEAVWQLVGRNLSVDSRVALRQLGIDEAALQVALERINTLRQTHLAYDATNHRIFDRRLSDHTITVQFCPRCNEAINLRLIADLQHIPKCPSCMYPIDQHELDRLKTNIVQGLRPVSIEESSDFSLGVFVALALFFPPGAIVYGIRHA